MPDLKLESKPDTRRSMAAQFPPPLGGTRRRLGGACVIPFLITLATVTVAAALCWAMWKAYMGTPWTRDGTVRVYVVTMAAEISGRIVGLPVADPTNSCTRAIS